MVLAEAQQKRWSSHYASSYDLGAYLAHLSRHSRFIGSVLADQPKRLLEVGTGSGTMSVFLSSLGYDVTSIDNDPAVLSVADETSRTLGGSVRLEAADAFDLPYERGAFDVAYSQGLMEHFSDEEIVRLLEEQLRIARVAVFSVPNNYYGQGGEFGDERFLTKERWEQIVTRFRVVESEHYHSVRSRRSLYRRRSVMYLCKLANEPPAGTGRRNGGSP